MSSVPPPLDAHQVLGLLLQIGLLLGMALLLGRLGLRWGIPAVVGELCAGVVLGPVFFSDLIPGFTRWMSHTLPLLDGVAQLGVLLLVGITGMNIDLKLMRREATTVVSVGAGALLVPLLLGAVVGLVLPADLMGAGTQRPVFAWFIGVALCVSSIPVIAKTLLEMRLLHRHVGQLTVGAAALNDVFGWVLLSVVSTMATTGPAAGPVLRTVLVLVLLISASLLVWRPLVNWLLRACAGVSDPGVSGTVVVLVLVSLSAATQAMGVEAILGAFISGMLIGSSRWVDRRRLVPLQTFVMTVLAPLFLATAGLRIDLAVLRRPEVLAWAGVVTLVAVVSKLVGAYLPARARKLSHWEAFAVGAGLNARGVIVVVIGMVGLQLGVLTGETYTIVVLVAIITSVMAPPILRYAARQTPISQEDAIRERALG